MDSFEVDQLLRELTMLSLQKSDGQTTPEEWLVYLSLQAS